MTLLTKKSKYITPLLTFLLPGQFRCGHPSTLHILPDSVPSRSSEKNKPSTLRQRDLKGSKDRRQHYLLRLPKLKFVQTYNKSVHPRMSNIMREIQEAQKILKSAMTVSQTYCSLTRNQLSHSESKLPRTPKLK